MTNTCDQVLNFRNCKLLYTCSCVFVNVKMVYIDEMVNLPTLKHSTPYSIPYCNLFKAAIMINM